MEVFWRITLSRFLAHQTTSVKNLLPYFACVIALMAITANAFGQDMTGVGYGNGVAVRPNERATPGAYKQYGVMRGSNDR